MATKTVQPPLAFLSPQFKPWVLSAVQQILPSWLRHQNGISEVQTENLEHLAALYEQFQLGKVRLLLAFRHPTFDDPPCLLHLINYMLPRVALQYNIKLQSPVHAHFLYDRGIPLWAGSHAGWLFSRLGATPIQRGKLDWAGLRSMRQLAIEGQFPLAIAPEGAVNGQSEQLSPLEPGIARLGFWSIEDLQKAGRSEEVLFVPIGIQYGYIRTPSAALERLFNQLERDSGLPKLNPPLPEIGQQSEEWFHYRLDRLSHHLLNQMEDFYNRFYRQTLPQTGTINERLHTLLDVALGVTERYFGVSPIGDFVDRRHRIEQAAWSRIYRSDLPALDKLSAVERGLANHLATEASLYLWHLHWTESFFNVSEQYVVEKPSLDRISEIALLLWSFVTRMKGGNPANRPQLGLRRAKFTVGEAISVTERWESYCMNRTTAIASLTETLQTSLESMIAEPTPEPVKVPLAT
ncbi:phospholipid/glycerol acyltransferase [Leptolyngbya sp. NIES-3755]|nr:phospholipid/glycerol acyltransferase [Leptolyngbya sp. NIES-3755]